MSEPLRSPVHARPRLRVDWSSYRPVRYFFVLPLLLLLTIVISPSSPPAQAHEPSQSPALRGDLGDAPDSTNHHNNANNTAYPGVPGRFPTVWDPTAGSPSGPLHLNIGALVLGANVTAESDADQLPDQDGVTNILNNGADNANNDEGDDGWLNHRTALFEHCHTTTLKVRITRSPNYTPTRAYLNVWFDGNHDGDWNDHDNCNDSHFEAVESSEWIVRNFIVNTGALTGTADIVVPTLPVLRSNANQAAWVRFTLSEEPAVRPSPDALADGRGPQPTNSATTFGYRYGETEDYPYETPNTGEPGQISIVKSASLTYTLPVASGIAIAPTLPPTITTLNGMYFYHIDVAHNGGTAAATVTVTDALPAEVELVDGPWVTEIAPEAAPLVADFDSGAGPSGTIKWHGALSPNAKIRITFKVKVKRCPDLTPNQLIIVNTAQARTPNGLVITSNEVIVPMLCPIPPTTHITLTKTLIRPVIEQQHDPANAEEARELTMGEEVGYLLTLQSSDILSQAVRISDTLPTGIVALDASASSGEVHIRDEGQTVIWSGELGPFNRPVQIKIRAKVNERAICNEPLVNIAYWWSRFQHGQSNPVRLRFACHDLGDAPDSTNHFNASMMAYPGVQAHFPTVFDVAAPERGPLHLRPQPLHLGPRVSHEREADLGFDSDGVHNIEPPVNRPNLDKADDGLVREKLSFNHCKRTTVPLLVTIAPATAALLSNANGIAYINVWVDSNRDGDWQDTFECPAEVSSNTPNLAREHIVIDHAINVAALGAGMHAINVPTSSPVAWPADLAGKPSWLRVTLSERPSNKTLGCGAGGANCTYGDGRGYDAAFALGESEDYLLPRLEQPQPDPTLDKRGYIYPNHNFDTNQTRWQIAWAIEYRNRGTGPANDTKVMDTYSAGQTFVSQYSHPYITPTHSANTLTYNVGTLNPGHTGYIVIQTAVPFNTPPGTVLSNTAVITSSSDTDPNNNTDVVTVTVPLMPPIITDPRPGTTCETTYLIKGKAQPGVVVDLYINDVLVGANLSVDANGNWSYNVIWLDGEHTLFAVAKAGGRESPHSPTIMVKVDSSLSWSPISLTFTDAAGHVVQPRDREGRMNESGWSVRLLPHTGYTVTVKLCCTDPNAQVTLDVPGITTTVQLTDPDGDHIYTASFTTGSQASLNNGTLRICVTCNLIRRCSDGTVLIDPAGVVFDVTQGIGSLIAGASVSCFQAQTSDTLTTFGLWPAASFGQANPQTTGSDGYYSFFTPAGTYQVNVTKNGYQPYRSSDIVVTNLPVEYNVPLTPNVNRAANYTITVSASGFEPAVLRVPPGSVIAWINVDGAPHTTTSTAPTALTSTSGWDSGLLDAGNVYLREMNALGTYTYRDQSNPTYSATIIVENNKVYLPLMMR